MNNTYRIGDARYVVAEDPIDMTKGPEGPDTVDSEEAPSESELVEDIADDPGTKWRSLYLQPIIRAIRSIFSLEEGQVALVGPKKDVPYLSDAYSFHIEGHIRFKDFVPDEAKYGTPPYRFVAKVDPNGELSKLIDIEGQGLD